MTGFDRMLADKLNWLKFNGHWFALFGGLNLFCYGLSLYMDRDMYLYHFGYSGYPARMFKPFKSMVGCDNIFNVLWTAPSLIGLNFYLHKKMGALFMTRFFFLTIFSTYFFMSIFNP